MTGSRHSLPHNTALLLRAFPSSEGKGTQGAPQALSFLCPKLPQEEPQGWVMPPVYEAVKCLWSPLALTVSVFVSLESRARHLSQQGAGVKRYLPAEVYARVILGTCARERESCGGSREKETPGGRAPAEQTALVRRSELGGNSWAFDFPGSSEPLTSALCRWGMMPLFRKGMFHLTSPPHGLWPAQPGFFLTICIRGANPPRDYNICLNK